MTRQPSREEASCARDYVVAPSGSCVGMTRVQYEETLADDPPWAERGRRLGARTFEIELSRRRDGAMRRPVVRSTPAPLTTTAAPALRELGVFAQPRTLLDQVVGLEMRKLDGNDVCCGFGGTFCVKYPAISNAVVDEKAAAIERTGAGLLLGGDLGCLMNMAGIGPVDPERVGREAASLLDDLASTRPTLAPVALADAFAERVTSPKVAATMDRIARVADLPSAVSRYMKVRRLGHAIALQPAAELLALDWNGFELHVALASDEAAGVGIARWGIAETGSLVFHPGADTPILANFLPLHHVVLVRAQMIVAYLEDYVAAAVATGERPPRNVNIITGASGTTDIEGSLVLGARGPRYLHVVVGAA